MMSREEIGNLLEAGADIAAYGNMGRDVHLTAAGLRQLATQVLSGQLPVIEYENPCGRTWAAAMRVAEAYNVDIWRQIGMRKQYMYNVQATRMGDVVSGHYLCESKAAAECLFRLQCSGRNIKIAHMDLTVILCNRPALMSLWRGHDRFYNLPEDNEHIRRAMSYR